MRTEAFLSDAFIVNKKLNNPGRSTSTLMNYFPVTKSHSGGWKPSSYRCCQPRRSHPTKTICMSLVVCKCQIQSCSWGSLGDRWFRLHGCRSPEARKPWAWVRPCAKRFYCGFLWARCGLVAKLWASIITTATRDWLIGLLLPGAQLCTLCSSCFMILVNVIGKRGRGSLCTFFPSDQAEVK